MFFGQQKNLWMGILSAFFSRYTHSGKHSWESLDYLKMYHLVCLKRVMSIGIAMLVCWKVMPLIPSYFLLLSHQDAWMMLLLGGTHSQAASSCLLAGFLRTFLFESFVIGELVLFASKSPEVYPT